MLGVCLCLGVTNLAFLGPPFPTSFPPQSRQSRAEAAAPKAQPSPFPYVENCTYFWRETHGFRESGCESKILGGKLESGWESGCTFVQFRKKGWDRWTKASPWRRSLEGQMSHAIAEKSSCYHGWKMLHGEFQWFHGWKKGFYTYSQSH